MGRAATEIAAHRGNSAVAPENTIPSFVAAAGLAPWVEWDVQTTSDGYFVVMHDTTVTRTTDGTGTVASHTLAEIQALDAGSWFSPAFAGTRVPTNAEAVASAQAHGQRMMIERKTGTSTQYYNEMSSLGLLDSADMMSFDWTFISQMNALHAPGTYVTLGSGSLTQSSINTQKANGSDVVGWDGSDITSKATVDLVHAAGLKMYVYTIDNPDSIARFTSYGVDRVITSDPGVLTRLLPTIDLPSGAARLDKTGSRTTDSRTISLRGQTPGFGLMSPDDNTGDIDLGYAAGASWPKGVGVQQSYGIVMANVNELGLRAGVEVVSSLSDPTNWVNGNASNGGLFLSTSRQDTGAEYNVDVSVGYFPYARGWTGALVRSTGAIENSGNLPAGTTTTQTGTGRYHVTMPGVSALNDGMLFVVGTKNNDANFVAAAPTASGWDVAVRNYDQDLAGGESDAWQFVYVPFSAANLIGGRVDASGSPVAGVGDYSLTHLAVGQYLLKLGSFTDVDGSLMLSVAQSVTSGGTQVVDDNFLAWAYDTTLGGFVVESRDMPDGSLADSGFSFAFMRYAAPLSVPEPTVIASLAFLGLGMRRRR